MKLTHLNASISKGCESKEDFDDTMSFSSVSCKIGWWTRVGSHTSCSETQPEIENPVLRHFYSNLIWYSPSVELIIKPED